MNKYFQDFFADEESISSDICIRWQKQRLYIDENMYKNPISLVGNNSETDVASSENIAALVNLCSNGINLEDAYSLIIHDLTFKMCVAGVSGLSVSKKKGENIVFGRMSQYGRLAEMADISQYRRLVNIAKEKMRDEL